MQNIKIRSYFLFIIFYSIFSVVVFASEDVIPVCNVNKECPFGFVCINGNANSTNEEGYTNLSEGAKYLGYCAPTTPLRQLCYLHRIMTGLFAKLIVALVIISLGATFLQGKMEFKQIATFFIGIALIFGSFQIIYILIGESHRSCEIIDYSVPVGFPPETYRPANNS